MSHPLVGWRTSNQEGWGLRNNLIGRGIFDDYHAGSKGSLYSKIATSLRRLTDARIRATSSRRDIFILLLIGVKWRWVY